MAEGETQGIDAIAPAGVTLPIQPAGCMAVQLTPAESTASTQDNGFDIRAGAAMAEVR